MADIVSWTSIEGLEKSMGKDAAAAFAKRLLGFLEGKVAELEQAFKDNNNDQILHCLHKLGSNAAALGALTLSQQARALEAGCVDGKWDDVKSQKEPILTLARQSLAILKERLG